MQRVEDSWVWLRTCELLSDAREYCAVLRKSFCTGHCRASKCSAVLGALWAKVTMASMSGRPQKLVFRELMWRRVFVLVH